MDQTAREWFEKHKDLLPKMTDGERVGGDPLIYADDPPSYLEFTRVLPYDEAEMANRHEHCCSPHRAMFVSAVCRTVFTPREVTVLLLRAFGMTQEMIAEKLHLSRRQVHWAEKCAMTKIRGKGNVQNQC